MKQSTVDYIKDLCLNKKLSQGNNMARAQVMLRNIKFFEAYGAATGYIGNIPFEELEKCLKAMVKKYDVMVGSILAITDIEGGVTWNGGMLRREGSSNQYDKDAKWMFTVHADDLYEYMVKLVLMSFIRIKERKIKKRVFDEIRARIGGR